ncbi:MAG TPA: hypothetical protein VMB05_02015, partial [Solirubrobacteraceae bacterium]|nr:hypothetical protein [Solirubrobacteraceae bacterium]
MRSLAPRTSLLLATALIVACGVAAPALAGITRLHGTIEGGPAFAGTQALGAFEAPGGFSVRTIYPRLDASPPTHVATRPDGQLQLAASSSLLALQRVRIGCPGEPGCKYESYELESDDLFVSAPPGAPFSCVVSLAASGCTRQRAPCRLSVDVLVAQTRLALQSCVGELSSSSEPQPESAEAGTLMIDESANPPSEQLLPQIVLPQAMAGPWLVGLAPNWESLGPPPLWLPSDGPAPVLVERNLLTGAEPLRIALPRIRNAPSLLNPGSYPATAAVQEDGTVAYLLPAGDHSTLWTASPTEPAPREIGAVAVDPEQRGDTLSVDEPILREGRLAIDTGTQVIIEALDGKQVTAVHGLPLGGIDFDGQHLLAAATPCTES